jgi:hypothetical protein
MASAPVVPAADGQAPAPQSADPLMPKEPGALLRTLGAAVIPATVALYVLGFMAAAPHYLRAGVPLSALSPQTFVAAGILFAILASVALLAGVGIWRSEKSGWRAYIENFTAFAAVAIVFVSAGVPYARAMLYGFYVAVLTLMVLHWLKGETFTAWRSDLVGAALYGAIGCVCAVGLPTLFAGLAYPVVPACYGGGRPEPLLSVSLGTSHEPRLPSRDRWALAPCRNSQPLPGPERCRTVYRVHDSQEWLFIAVVELPGACPSTPPTWESWRPFWPLSGRTRTGCFQRVANSKVRRLETPGEP